MLKTNRRKEGAQDGAYHLGEGRMLKTSNCCLIVPMVAYHLGEGRMLKNGR